MADSRTSTSEGFAEQICLPENPTTDEASHEGPRGYAHALKDTTTFVVLGPRGDINAAGHGEQGLYHRGTRHLSRLTLAIGGLPPILLESSTRRDNSSHSTHLLTPALHGPDVDLQRGAVHIERAACVRGDCYYERLELTSYAAGPVTLPVSYRVDADFRDIFEIRGIERARRGRTLATTRDAGGLRLGYAGLDGIDRFAEIHLSPAPTASGDQVIEREVRLEPRRPVHLELRVRCQPGAAICTAGFREAVDELAAERSAHRLRGCIIATSSELYDRWIDRSAADLWMMTTPTPEGPYPLAGLPWFTTIFGRDGILTALAALWWDPHLAAGVLRGLAATQARESDPARDAEPGKILHEMRDGEMAALGEIPFGRYYGSVDATPLYVMLAGAYLRTTGDRLLIGELWPTIERALGWIDRYRDDLVTYRPSPAGLIHQGWKDSHDSLFHADGRGAPGPIALCEVQGYAYAARRAGATIAAALGHGAEAGRLRTVAERARRRFEERFWVEELDCYAMAIDGEGQPCRVRSSNAGHALFAGIADPERAERIGAAMMRPDMFSGWGVRTLSSDTVWYNPASYHNGSVWPHDTAIVAEGFRRYGMTERAATLLQAAKQASARVELHRLPELFCGFGRQPDLAPTPYPSACAPQAWAASSVFQLLAAALGLDVDAAARRVTFRQPALPEDLDEVELRDLRAGDVSMDIVIYRRGHRVAVAVTRSDGRAEVVVVP